MKWRDVSLIIGLLGLSTIFSSIHFMRLDQPLASLSLFAGGATIVGLSAYLMEEREGDI